VSIAVLLLLGQASAAHISQKLRSNIDASRRARSVEQLQLTSTLGDHFNDSDDIPAGLDPPAAGLAQRGMAQQRMDEEEANRAWFATGHVDPEEEDKEFV